MRHHAKITRLLASPRCEPFATSARCALQKRCATERGAGAGAAVHAILCWEGSTIGFGVHALDLPVAPRHFVFAEGKKSALVAVSNGSRVLVILVRSTGPTSLRASGWSAVG